MKNKNFNQFNNKEKGFTLVELMVVVSIIIVITALTLFNNNQLNSSILVSNTAYEIGLIVRDAQVSGLGSKLISNSGTATTSNQGVYFDGATPEKIIFFADINNNNKFDSLTDPNQVYNIENKRAGRIMKICTINNTDGTCNQVTDLIVLFKRPNPESYFYKLNNGLVEEIQGSVAINIGFENKICRTLVIYKTGAIQIDQSFCTYTP